MGLVDHWNVAHRGVAAMFMLALASCGGQGQAGQADPGRSAGQSAGPSAAEAAWAGAQNPCPCDEQSVRLGRAVYAKNCQSCHGARGKGDGPAAGRLNVEMPDLTDPDVQSQSDGELFSLVTKGSKPMPAYRRLLSEEQRWHVINYLRATFAQPVGRAGDRKT
jgi:mono/diheme cytochrome c family protein